MNRFITQTVLTTFIMLTLLAPASISARQLLAPQCAPECAGATNTASASAANVPLSRGAAIELVVAAMGWGLLNPATNRFHDVPGSSPLFRVIETGAAHDIIDGYKDSTFRPDLAVTRAQVTKIIDRALGWAPCSTCNQRFSDVPRSNPFFGAIEIAVGNGIIGGNPDGTFRPGGSVTRAEFSTILDAALVKGSPAIGGAQTGASTPRIYWGAYIQGSTYNSGNAPWDSSTVDTFEDHVGKKLSILHWGQPWYYKGSFQKFAANVLEGVRARGSIPMIDWASWDSRASGDQPKFKLSTIVRGDHDSYIRAWATAAKAWGKPFFLRLNWEMNGNWFPWSEGANGNKAGEYVAAWRHVHDIFTAVGATNVTWVWSVNTEYAGSANLERLYPGDSYVDWTAIDGYNWGLNPANPDLWKPFYQVFKSTYDHLLRLAPDKPVMIAEIASTEKNESKAEWITDALTVQLPTNFPRVKALLWMNWNVDGMDWVIESSTAAQTAFTAAISRPYYAANEFANLSAAPIVAP